LGEHEEHDVDEHEAHPEVPDAIIDIFFVTWLLPHAGHRGGSVALMGTSASNSCPHFLHLYS